MDRTAESVHQVFFRVEEKHWWFVARRRVVLHLLRRYLKPDRSLRVCDVGTGCGATLLELSRRYSAVGMDISQEAVDFACGRGVEVLLGSLPGRVPFAEASCDAALALDVIEHVEDDLGAVAALVRVLKPGGIFIATVPAYQWLWTRRDDYHSHKRRYTRSMVSHLLHSSGLSVEVLSYFNTMLFPLAAADRLVKKAFHLDRAAPDVAIPAWPLNSLMREVFAFERFLIPHLRLPYGLSLVAIARKPARG